MWPISDHSSFAERSAAGRRHPGHDDDPEDADEVRRKLEAGHWEPLDIPGELIRVRPAEEEVDAGDLARRVARTANTGG